MRYIMSIALLWLLHSIALSQNASHDEKINALLESLRDNDQPKVTYADLAAKADLVVIATLIEKRHVASDIVGATDFDSDSVQRVSNKLKILSVMKGAANEEIEMITTEWGPKTVVLGFRSNFAVLRTRMLLPSLSAVEIDGVITDWGIMDGSEKTSIVPEYLIYLKRSSRDNGFIPVTGQRWAGSSVRLLNF